MKPGLSVIVPALLGYDTVLAALDAWETQSCRDRLEIIVLCPTEETGRSLPAGQFVIATGAMDLHEARAAAIRKANADHVVLAEDHCLPDRLWAQAILRRLAEGGEAIGPALRSGNPKTTLAQASFLLGYGQWMMPVKGGQVEALPGHNVVLPKSTLLAMGPALEHDLLVAAFLLQRLHRQGMSFYLEENATMRHFDIYSWKRCLQIFGAIGLGFGAIRTQNWPLAGRGLYWLATPVVAAKHWARALANYRRAGAAGGLGLMSVVVALLLATAWAFGEAVGALMGVHRVTPFVSFSEIKPVARCDV